jgi:hypothetical protein
MQTLVPIQWLNNADRHLIKMYELDDFNLERYFYLVYHINRTQSLMAKKFIEHAESWLVV